MRGASHSWEEAERLIEQLQLARSGLVLKHLKRIASYGVYSGASAGPPDIKAAKPAPATEWINAEIARLQISSWQFLSGVERTTLLRAYLDAHPVAKSVPEEGNPEYERQNREQGHLPNQPGDGINAPAIDPRLYPSLYLVLVGQHDAIQDLARYVTTQPAPQRAQNGGNMRKPESAESDGENDKKLARARLRDEDSKDDRAAFSEPCCSCEFIRYRMVNLPPCHTCRYGKRGFGVNNYMCKFE